MRECQCRAIFFLSAHPPIFIFFLYIQLMSSFFHIFISISISLSLYLSFSSSLGLPRSDAESGTLRVWNVSRSTPLENIQVHQSGFHTLCACPGFTVSRREDKTPAHEDLTVRLPTDVRIISLFRDGGVGLYNVRKRSWDFLRDTVSFHFTRLTALVLFCFFH